MGLDMYLKAEKYLGDWEFSKVEERAAVHKILEAVQVNRSILDSHSPSVTVRLNVGYWRKANQIHAWFVKNVQDGKDDCQETYVGREKLQQLLEECENALTTKDASILPPQSGFFFGSTTVDEYYWKDLEDTKQMLTRVLVDETLKDCEFYYRPSW